MVETWRAWIAGHDLHHLPSDSDIRKVLAEREDIRRQLTTLLFNHGETKPDDVFGLTYPVALIQGVESLDWLLDRLPEAPPDSRKNWAMAVARLASAPEVAAKCWDKLLSRIESVPELAMLFEWLRPWDLNEKREDASEELAQLAVGFNGVSSDFRVATCLLDCTLPPARSPST